MRFCLILKSALSVNTWKVQVVVLATIKSFVERLVQCTFLHSTPGEIVLTVVTEREYFHSRMDWTTGIPDGEGLGRSHRVDMLRKLLAEFIPPVCESLGLLPTYFFKSNILAEVAQC